MAEGTTRVDETGGEPIASHLEWSAAKVGRGRPGFEAAPGARRTAEPYGARYEERGYESRYGEGRYESRFGPQPAGRPVEEEEEGPTWRYRTWETWEREEPVGRFDEGDWVVLDAGAAALWERRFGAETEEQRRERLALEGGRRHFERAPAEARQSREAAERMQREARKAAANRPPKTKEALRRDIEANRRVVAEIVEELDQRRREFMDVRLQFRRHRATILAGAFGFLLLAGTSVFLIVRRQQVRQRQMMKVRRLRDAFGRMADRPEIVARPSPSVREKALASAASGASLVLAKKIAERIATSL